MSTHNPNPVYSRVEFRDLIHIFPARQAVVGRISWSPAIKYPVLLVLLGEPSKHYPQGDVLQCKQISFPVRCRL